MLARCHASCTAAGFTPDLSHQAFGTFSYDRRFAAIIVPVSSFTLITDAETARGVLARFRDYLEPGGLLLLDLSPLVSLASRADDRRRWTTPDGELLILEGIVTGTDWTCQTIERTYRYERWRDHTLVETEIDILVQRHWGLDEMRLALTAAGFGEITVHADYCSGRPPADGTRVLTFEVRAV
jgi:hypothetical protein